MKRKERKKLCVEYTHESKEENDEMKERKKKHTKGRRNILLFERGREALFAVRQIWGAWQVDTKRDIFPRAFNIFPHTAKDIFLLHGYSAN